MAWRFRPFKRTPEAVDKVESMRQYLAINSYALSSFAIFYGVLTYAFGSRLWPPERSAFNIPHAPQSCGTVMLILGVITIVISHRRLKWSRYVSWAMKTLTLVWGIFAMTFLVDIIQDQSPASWPPFGLYLMLAILCANRASLEDQWRE